MSSDKTTILKKTGKGSSVPSRYMQAAESYSSQSSREKSSRDTKCMKRSPQRFGNETIQQSTASFNPTESVLGKGCATKFTSTPATRGQYVLPSIDASVITDESGFLCVPHMKEKTIRSSSDEKKYSRRNKVQDQTLSVVPSQRIRRNSNQTNKNDEMEIELLYSEYLQVKLLESNAKKALVERSKNAMGDIHKVWCLIQVLLEQNNKAKKELNVVSYLITLHQHLKRQEEILVPALEILPLFEKQYEEIAKAVDIARHKLEVKDILLPDPGSENEIIMLLQNISHSLSNILDRVPDREKIVSAAAESSAFVNKGKLIAEEIKRSSELVSQANDLLLSETSLKLSKLKLPEI